MKGFLGLNPTALALCALGFLLGYLIGGVHAGLVGLTVALGIVVFASVFL